MLTLPSTRTQRLGHCRTFLIILIPDAPCFLAATQARGMGPKNDRGLKKFLLPAIGHMRELIQATVAHVDAIATRSSFAAGSFFGEPRWMCIVLGVRNETIHLLTLEHRRASGVSSTSLRTATAKRSFRKRTASSCAAPCTRI